MFLLKIVGNAVVLWSKDIVDDDEVVPVTLVTERDYALMSFSYYFHIHNVTYITVVFFLLDSIYNS